MQQTHDRGTADLCALLAALTARVRALATQLQQVRLELEQHEATEEVDRCR